MKYETVYLKSFVDDMRWISVYMLESEYPEDVVDKFQIEVKKQTESLRESPKRFTVYEKIPEFRRMLVLYDYQIYFTIREDKKLVQIHHILHSHRNILSILRHECEITKQTDQFYSEINQSHLRGAIKRVEATGGTEHYLLED